LNGKQILQVVETLEAEVIRMAALEWETVLRTKMVYPAESLAFIGPIQNACSWPSKPWESGRWKP